jgi:hypothetical protein
MAVKKKQEKDTELKEDTKSTQNTPKLFHKSFEKLKTYANATIGGYRIPINMTGEAGV